MKIQVGVICGFHRYCTIQGPHCSGYAEKGEIDGYFVDEGKENIVCARCAILQPEQIRQALLERARCERERAEYNAQCLERWAAMEWQACEADFEEEQEASYDRLMGRTSKQLIQSSIGPSSKE